MHQREDEVRLDRKPFCRGLYNESFGDTFNLSRQSISIDRRNVFDHRIADKQIDFLVAKRDVSPIVELDFSEIGFFSGGTG